MLTALAIANYRSLRHAVVPLQRLNVVTGANGSGKSNLYRALRLLADTAQGRIVHSLAAEGGLSSTLWAGPEAPSAAVRRGEMPLEGTRRKQPVSLRLGFASDEFGYLIDLGLPPQSPETPPAFKHDPAIKRECIWHGAVQRPASTVVDRDGPILRVRDAAGEWAVADAELSSFDSMFFSLADPARAPEMWRLREAIRNWRFYDHFRTDSEAPVRAPRIGTFTPILSNDGADLAAAIQTILELGDAESFRSAINNGFPGSEVEVNTTAGRFELTMRQPGLLRALSIAELSEGTLRYLFWTAALLTPRPPALMVLNEPETSLHPDLLPPLAALIRNASRRTQLVVVTHAAPLAAALANDNAIHLEKRHGETTVAGFGLGTTPPWHWPAR